MTSGYHLLNSLSQIYTKIPRKRKRKKWKKNHNNKNWDEQKTQWKNLGGILNKEKANGSGLIKKIYTGPPESKCKLVSGNRSSEKWGRKKPSSSLRSKTLCLKKSKILVSGILPWREDNTVISNDILHTSIQSQELPENIWIGRKGQMVMSCMQKTVISTDKVI